MGAVYTGGKRIYYGAPFVPAEWISAHGLIPYVFRPKGVGQTGPIESNAGICAYMRAFVNEALDDVNADAIVLTTTCDQLRHAFDLICDRYSKPSFLLNVPATWQTAAAHRYYMTEIERLSGFLADCGGTAPSKEKLVSTMKQHEEMRTALLSQPQYLSGLNLTAALTSFFETGGLPQTGSPLRTGVPIAVVGGPLTRADCRLFSIIEELGGTVALDGTENGERMLPGRFDRRQLADQPFRVLCNAYFGSIPDVFSRPNSGFFSWLDREVKSRAVKGLILVRYIWCDGWHAEVNRIFQWLGIPCIDLDLTGGDIETRSRMRIAALLEALE